MNVGYPQAPTPIPPWSGKVRSQRVPVFEIVILILAILGTLACFVAYSVVGGLGTTAFMALLALPSLVAVVLTLERIDRWEVEPIWTRLVALGWGAGVATLLAGEFNAAGHAVLSQATWDTDLASAGTAVFVAPLTEETFKAFIVVMLVWWRRNDLHSPLDGVVLGGLSGAGFAFVENIQYLLAAGEEGAVIVGWTWFLRGVLSPFLHPMATSLTGMALAWAVTRTRSPHAWLWAGPLGWFAAVSLHGLWNLLAVTAGDAWLATYVVIQVPLFFAWLIALLQASRAEARRIVQGLQPAVRAGWVLPVEVQMATHAPSRRAAIIWASRAGTTSKKAMVKFLNRLCALGLDGDRAARGLLPADRVAQLPEVLPELAQLRWQFLGNGFHHNAHWSVPMQRRY